jgi:hypothetical protein
MISTTDNGPFSSHRVLVIEGTGSMHMILYSLVVHQETLPIPILDTLDTNKSLAG